ncbi:PQQ-dependent sugar dehydrogenase [Nocardia huaxiensis]|uniref:PQQ-dependent sugar dehydrogenase n=1 Tax=Nocardia huaxiensis TaxID=2755382 RepID=UPI001E5A8228|nr:PQQ-dependent sugar dehydrogenase [Nocardia huaxiensis]UFS96392.1 PQQ-dependent sugar dehydrogenase [Nocardia huaxiensis]
MSSFRGRTGVRAGKVSLSILIAAVLATGCARFDDSASGPFTTEPTWKDADFGPEKPSPTTSTKPEGPCIDQADGVVGTCFDVTSGVVGLPDGTTGLVGELKTGGIYKIDSADPTPMPPAHVAPKIAQLDVDGSGDGGLSDITISPTYYEDGLMYAYITTPSDNRVVRIGEDGTPKPILTGIPKSATGNHGAIEFISETDMLVLTGDAGDPAAAANPNSLAGKLLRIKLTPGATSQPEVVTSGIATAGDVCVGPGGTIWVTDRTAVEDRLRRVTPDGALVTGWTWTDHPGVAGCVAAADSVSVAMTEAKGLAIAAADKDTHAITAVPSLQYQNAWGRLNGAAPGPNGSLWLATVNKAPGGEPGPNDDRVILISPLAAQGSGPD